MLRLDFRTYDRSNSERRNYGDNREKQTNHETVKGILSFVCF